MALQGTLDTFALADLVRLLATTSKTGELAIDGDRGSGRLWFADGQLVGGEPTADDLADVVFTLLRTEEGEFAFHVDVAPDDAREPHSALDVLATAEARLEEWRPVAELVPSPRVALSLREELPTDEVTIDRERWRTLLAVAAGRTAGDLAAALDRDEMATGFVIRDLVEAGLVEVGDEVEDETAEDPQGSTDGWSADEPVPAVEVVPVAVNEPTPVVVLAPVEAVAPEPVTSTDPIDPFGDPLAEPAAFADPAPFAEPVPAAEPTVAATEPETPVEVPPVLGVVPDPPYSFGAWGDGPVPAPELQADPASLGPWEPLTPVAADPVAPAAPVAPLPSLEGLPSLDGPDETDDLASYAVDLDSPLGAASGHSYLGTAEPGAGLPEPLLGSDGVPTSDAAALAAPPDPPAPASYPEPGTGAADELAARRDHGETTASWGAPAPASDDLGVPMDSLSPAAARALAAAASADADPDDDTDAGRRVLRRIISTGKG